MKQKRFRRMLRLLMAVFMVLLSGTMTTYATEGEEKHNISVLKEEKVIEVSTWEELAEAFQSNKPKTSFTTTKDEMEYFTIRLMENLSVNALNSNPEDTVIKQFAIYHAFVTFDFNGHNLFCSHFL